MSETSNGKLDISEYDSAEEAARALYEYITETFEADDAMLWDPETTAKKFGENNKGHWTVMWESGPMDWSVHLTGGESMFRAEMPQFSEPEVVGFYENDNWIAEPHGSRDLVFTDTQ